MCWCEVLDFGKGIKDNYSIMETNQGQFNGQQEAQSQPLSPQVPAGQPMGRPVKPGKVQAISIMLLVLGIFNCLAGFSYIFGIVTIPFSAYLIVLGILEIIHSTKLMADPITADQPAKYLAIMEIIAIITCNVPALVIGILSIVFYGDPEVEKYYSVIRASRPGPRS